MHRMSRSGVVALALVSASFFVQLAFAEDLKPIDTMSRGTIKGQVTLAGTPPAVGPANAALLAQMTAHADKNNCLAGNKEETEQQTLRIGKTGGIANVVVYVRPQPGSYFQLTPADLKAFQPKGEKCEVVLDQPHCAFIPHVAIAFPSYLDANGKQVATGQVFKVKNSAPMAHNSKWGGTRLNPGGNPNLPPGTEVTLKDLKADKFPIPVACGMHTWMNAYIIALDNPFIAITDEDGNFEIKNVPAGTELQIFAWHETGFASKNGFKGETITVAPGAVLKKDFQK